MDVKYELVELLSPSPKVVGIPAMYRMVLAPSEKTGELVTSQKRSVLVPMKSAKLSLGSPGRINSLQSPPKFHGRKLPRRPKSAVNKISTGSNNVPSTRKELFEKDLQASIRESLLILQSYNPQVFGKDFTRLNENILERIVAGNFGHEGNSFLGINANLMQKRPKSSFRRISETASAGKLRRPYSAALHRRPKRVA